ncbi:MAG: prepilin-type N-terminal cleavage/methylation domain-containing protein [Burkholderiaceae bacterium]|nr:MAG: prepilin-type N-terminal cleavage/methylation domain-containing protein [Burkholderiaceae bacterium]
MMQRKHPACSGEQGLTLLELVVALALSALIALIGSTAMSNAVDFYHRGNERALAREELRAAERILRHEWSSRGQRVAASITQIEFDTVLPVTITLPQPPSVARVRYVCERTEDAQTWTLRHDILPLQHDAPAPSRTGSPPLTPLESTIIASRLHACNFSLLAQAPMSQGSTQPRWITAWSPNTSPPTLLRVAMSFRDDMPALVFQSRSWGRP